MLTALLWACAPSPLDDTDTPASRQAPEDPPGLFTFDGPRPRNVLLLSIDTFQVRRMGRYTGTPTTPELDRLLAQGVTFERHRSCSSWTMPAMLCVLSGRYNQELGYVPNFIGGHPDPVPDGTDLLSDWLHERRYATGIVTANSFLTPAYNMTGGYDRRVRLELEDAAVIAEAGLETLDELVAEAEPEAPWFLHLHFMDTHAPYTVAEGYGKRLELRPDIGYDLGSRADANWIAENWAKLDDATRAAIRVELKARYEGNMHYLDEHVGLLLDELDARGELDETLVVVVSDHGEHLLEDDQLGHGQDLSRLQFEAVAGFWARGLQTASWDGVTSHVDVLPAMWEAMGWDPRDDFTGRVPTTEGSAYGELYRELATWQGIERDGHKLLYEWGGQKLLFDLESDPDEQTDLYDPDDPRVVALWDELLPLVEGLYGFFPEGDAPTDPGP